VSRDCGRKGLVYHFFIDAGQEEAVQFGCRLATFDQKAFRLPPGDMDRHRRLRETAPKARQKE
jgi:hypothetical protein